MKITKATIKAINKHRDVSAIWVIGEILNRSAVILGDPGRYEINDNSLPSLAPIILSDGKRDFVSGQTASNFERCIIRGLATKYPRWIQGTLTHGLNGVQIYDVNALVKAIIAAK